MLNSCIISNPTQENCKVVEITVTKISKGGIKDIIIDNNENHLYYINRGLERGLSLEDLESTILNKRVTLHHAKIITGTSKHVAQLSMENEIIYSEFK